MPIIYINGQKKRFGNFLAFDKPLNPLVPDAH